MRCYLTAAVVVLAAATLEAKRTSDYVAPPYSDRAARAFLGFFILVSPVLIACVLVALRADAAKRRIARSCTLVLLLTGIGALYAATDALNDELWNPAFAGCWFIGAALPVGISSAVGASDKHRRAFVLGSIILALPVAIFTSSVGQQLLIWLYSHGLPSAW